MTRYVFRYQGAGAKPERDVEQIRRHSALKVVGESPRMVLVDGEPGVIDRVRELLDGWSVAPERQYSLPDPRPTIKRRIDM